MHFRAVGTAFVGLGVTIASTFASSWGLSIHQQRIAFAAGVLLMIVGGLLYARGGKTSTDAGPSLEVHLRLKLDEAKALAHQMHEFAPGATLEPARAWRGDVYKMLRERPAWARKFLEETEEIPTTTDGFILPARGILEHQIERLERLLSSK